MSVLKHQDSWPTTVSPRFQSPKHEMRTNSQISLREKSYILTKAGNKVHSQEDILTGNLSHRSNTIPMIEIGKSLENLKGHDSSLEFNSLDNLDGFARGLSFRSGDCVQPYGAVPDRQANYVTDQHWSLDTMLSITEFQRLGTEDKHQLILRLVPLLKPFASQLGQNLSSLDMSVGEAASLLDKYNMNQGMVESQEQSNHIMDKINFHKHPQTLGRGKNSK